jgi:hypothetical protein
MPVTPNKTEKKKSVKLFGVTITKSKIKSGGIKKKLLEVSKPGGEKQIEIVKTKTKIGGKKNWAPEKIKETTVKKSRPSFGMELNIKKKKQGVEKEPNKVTYTKY